MSNFNKKIYVKNYFETANIVVGSHTKLKGPRFTTPGLFIYYLKNYFLIII